MIGRSLEFVRCGDNLCFALYDGKNVTTAATGIVGFSASIVAAPAEIHFVQSPDCLGTPITLPDLMAGLVKIAPRRNLSAVSANKCCVSTLCTSERRVCPHSGHPRLSDLCILRKHHTSSTTQKGRSPKSHAPPNLSTITPKRGQPAYASLMFGTASLLLHQQSNRPASSRGPFKIHHRYVCQSKANCSCTSIVASLRAFSNRMTSCPPMVHATNQPIVSGSSTDQGAVFR